MARTGRPRTESTVRPIDHLEAFCCAQYLRLSRQLRDAPTAPVPDPPSRFLHSSTIGLEVESRHTPGTAPLRSGARYGGC